VVDTAVSLTTGAVVTLPAMDRPALSDGVVYTPAQGHVTLKKPSAAKPSAFERTRFAGRTAAPGISSAGVAVVQESALSLLASGSRVVRSVGGSGTPVPMGWHPPAVSDDWVAWVVDGGPSGADVWWIQMAGGTPTELDGGPGDQHHVVAQGQWLAWVRPEEVVIMDTTDHSKTTVSAQTGFSAGLSLWQGVACWETREGADVDIACSDGVKITGDGHQRWPSRWDRWLLYRDGDTVFLHTVDSP